MKIKLVSFLIFLSGLSFGQNWSPIGATWYYNISYAASSQIDFHKVYCDSIVNFKGINCKKINIDYGACNNHFGGKLYTYENNDTVFFYNADVDTFEILYNFNAVQGDFWKIRENVIDTATIRVDSISTMVVNGKLLKKLFVTYIYNWDNNQHKSTIIESLGDIGFLVNILDPSYGVCDMDFIGGLRCYEDSTLGFYSTGIVDSCTYKTTSIDFIQIDNDFIVFPNPSNGNFQVKLFSIKANTLEITDVLGNKILEFAIKNSVVDLDLTSQPKGIYFVKVTDYTGNFVVKKIVKE